MLSKNLLYKRIRQFALETPDWATAIRYHSKPDEQDKLISDIKMTLTQLLILPYL